MIRKIACGSNPTAKEDCVGCQPSAVIHWDLLDSELNSCVSSLYKLLCQNEVSTTTAAKFALELSRYLTDYGATNQRQATKLGNATGQNCPMLYTEFRLTREKNQARTTFRDNRWQFLQLVHAHHRLVQISRTQTAVKSVMKQEQTFPAKILAICKVSVWTDQKRSSKPFSRGSLQSFSQCDLRQNGPVHRDAKVGSQIHTSNNARHF